MSCELPSAACLEGDLDRKTGYACRVYFDEGDRGQQGWLGVTLASLGLFFLLLCTSSASSPACLFPFLFCRGVQ